MSLTPEQKVLLDPQRLGELLQSYRARLRRMISLRLDPVLHARMDPSDVIQEALVEVTERLAEYRRRPSMPFYLWVRFITQQKLVELHRRNLAAQKRDVRRECAEDAPAISLHTLSRLLRDDRPSPSQQAGEREEQRLLLDALEQMAAPEREVLALRHFEELSNRDAALAMGVSEATASRRYKQAMLRISSHLNRHD